MIREREELELVTDEGVLRASDLLVIKACAMCGADHGRFMLLARSASSGVGPWGAWSTPDACWSITDYQIDCIGRTTRVFAPRNAIARGILYRVRTGIESEIVGSVPAEPIAEPVQ